MIFSPGTAPNVRSNSGINAATVGMVYHRQSFTGKVRHFIQYFNKFFSEVSPESLHFE